MSAHIATCEVWESGGRRSIGFWLAVAAAVNCILQLCWFAPTCFGYIDYDGMAYVGVARHITSGDLQGSINAFRSPLYSWLIAALFPVTHDLIFAGKLLTILSFLLCVWMVFRFTDAFWNSYAAAGAAALWFSAGRGLLPTSVQMISPDFLLANLVLAYFLMLRRCIRQDHTRDWFLLGGIHSVAFLAKAFALPWLALITVLTAFLAARTQWIRAARCVLIAALLPLVVVAVWSTALHSKYGHFMTGSQFKANLFAWTLKQHWYSQKQGYRVLRDDSPFHDSYMVDDPLPPESPLWEYHPTLAQVGPKVLSTEFRNVPRAIKEVAIVATPGGMLLFILAVVILIRHRAAHREQFRMVFIITVGGIALIAAYSMLVFDERYVFPLVPLIVAVAAGLAVHASPSLRLSATWHRLALILIAAGMVFTLAYRTSSFRTLTRRFEASCIAAAGKLKSRPGNSVISIGEGPYPEHGIGWEAGFKAAFLADRRVIASEDRLPALEMTEAVADDILKANPDAIIVWGTFGDQRAVELIKSIKHRFRTTATEPIVDASLGKVGDIVFFR